MASLVGLGRECGGHRKDKDQGLPGDCALQVSLQTHELHRADPVPLPAPELLRGEGIIQTNLQKICERLI